MGEIAKTTATSDPSYVQTAGEIASPYGSRFAFTTCAPTALPLRGRSISSEKRQGQPSQAVSAPVLSNAPSFESISTVSHNSRPSNYLLAGYATSAQYPDVSLGLSKRTDDLLLRNEARALTLPHPVQRDEADRPLDDHLPPFYGPELGLPESGRPYKCDQCSQSFNRNHDLKRHKRSHLATKRYPCGFCEKSFSRKDALKRHRTVRGCGASDKLSPGPESSQDTTDEYVALAKCHDVTPPGPFSFQEVNTERQDRVNLKGPDSYPRALPSPRLAGDYLRIPVEDTTSAPVASELQHPRTPAVGTTTRVPQPTLPRDEEAGEPVAAHSPLSEVSSAVSEPYVDRRKRKIIDGVVAFVTRWIEHVFTIAQGAGSTTGGSSSSTIPSGNNLSPQGSQGSDPNGKRRRLTNRNGPGDEDDENDAHRDRNTHDDTKQDTKQTIGNMLACPYFKYDPATYKTWTSCPGPGWRDIHRVKEHLYRRHRQPRYRCGRCWQPFEDEASHLEHQRMPDPCPLSRMEPVQGFDAAQETRLKSRKRTKPELSETRKWREVFKILFPDVEDGDIPSPFYEYGQPSQTKGKGVMSHDNNDNRLAECEAYILREAPSRLRLALSRELDRDLNLVEEGLRRKATAYFQSLIPELFREFRAVSRPTVQGDDNVSALGAMVSETIFGGMDFADVNFSTTNFDTYSDMGVNLNPFSMLGDPELGFDQGGLLENLMEPADLGNNGAKPSDSGYESNNPTQGTMS